MAFWEAGFGGNYGGSFRIRVNVDVVTQEVGNNRSLIRYNAYVDRVSSTGGTIYNYGTTCGNTNINGYNPQRCIGSYSTGGTGRVFTMAANEDYWIGHDGAGNANPYFGANYDFQNSPYVTSGATGGNYSLPNIPRYANITGLYFSEVTDVSFKVNTTTDTTCNFLQYSINGSGWIDQYGGSFTAYGFTLTGLASGTDYNIRVRVRRQDSGLWTESGKIYTTTAVQNKFFGDK